MKRIRKHILLTTLILSFLILVMPTSYAAEELKVYHNGQEIDFDQSPLLENGRTLVPIRAIAEEIGMLVDYNTTTKTATLTKTEQLLKIPFDQEHPYVEGKSHVIAITINQQTAVVDGVPKTLDISAKSIGGRIFVPLRFISEAMDLDVIWEDKGNILISDRLRGSEPLQGEKVFPTLTTNSISFLTGENKKITLGMDVTEMQAILGSPQFVWGRGNPAPILNYSYSNEGIVCCLGKIVTITIGSESKFKKADGISIGDSYKDIRQAYSLDQIYIDNNNNDLGIYVLFYGDKATRDYKTATHWIHYDFADNSEKITSIEIVDLVTFNELRSFE